MTDSNGCKTSFTQTNMINVYPLPKASFNAAPQPTTMLDPSISFTNTTVDSCTWQWIVVDSDSLRSALKNPPMHTYLDTGCYFVRLVVTDKNGCRDTSKMNVCIDPEFTFYAPNSFTPNGDGINDVWMPSGVGIDPNNYTLSIWDRWGNLMFITYAWGQSWDGTANNGIQKAQIDTYVWQVDLKDFSHQNHHYKGICSLIK